MAQSVCDVCVTRKASCSKVAVPTSTASVLHVLLFQCVRFKFFTNVKDPVEAFFGPRVEADAATVERLEELEKKKRRKLHVYYVHHVVARLQVFENLLHWIRIRVKRVDEYKVL